jgi:hypothetical protein
MFPLWQPQRPVPRFSRPAGRWSSPPPSGVEARFRQLVAKCKVSTNFSPAIAEVLGVRGEEIPGRIFPTWAPS